MLEDQSFAFQLMRGEDGSKHNKYIKDGTMHLFEELLWIVFQLFDAIWSTQALNWSDHGDGSAQHYFKFGEIFNETKRIVLKTLNREPKNYGTFKVFQYSIC